jgi:YVTN family beta-propeller protein
VVGLSGALVGAAPDGASAVAARTRCRATAFVTNALSASVTTIDVKTRTTHRPDIPVATDPFGLAITPDGKTAFVTNVNLGTVSTIDVKTRKKNPTDIPVGTAPNRVAITPDGKTAFVPTGSGTVSTIDVKTRTKHPTDIPVGPLPYDVAVTPDGKTVFVTNQGNDTVSTIDVKTRTKHPTDIAVGTGPKGVAVTPDGKTAFVNNGGSLVGLSGVPATVGDSVSTIDVKSRTKHPTDIPVAAFPLGVAVTPDGKTAFVNGGSGTVSTIDVKTRTKNADIPVGTGGAGVAVTPDGKTLFVTNGNVGNAPDSFPSSGTVSTIDVKTRKKNPADITVGTFPFQVAFTPCRR